MKIKKVYIKNFKGIKEKRIIDFKNSTTLLIGPNGFGKTTIYDVIELCLTGKLHRTFVKQRVTNDAKDYKKPFYQNTSGEDVVVKLWLEKENNENLIIVKFLDKDNSGTVDGRGRKNKPNDFGLLKTFTENTEDFEKDLFYPEKNLSQSQINSFFEFRDTEFKIEDIYYLFNYLQQEENTYFLKKSENERKDELKFLFQTSEAEEKLHQIDTLIFDINQIIKDLDKKIESIEGNEKVKSVPYEPLFEKNDFLFDRKTLFDKKVSDLWPIQKEEYLEELSTLIKFKQEFSPEEFQKKNKLLEIDKLIENQDFLYYFVLKDFMLQNEFEKIRSNVNLIKNRDLLERFILQKIISKSNEYIQNDERYTQLNKYLEILEKNDAYSSLNEIEKIIKDLKPDLSEKYNDFIKKYNLLSKTTNEIEETMREILRLRQLLRDETSKQCNHPNLESECPYCGHNWNSFESLMLAFDKRTENLSIVLSEQSKELLNLKTDFEREIFIPLKDNLSKKIESHLKIDGEVLRKISDFKHLEMGLISELNNIPTIQKFIWVEIESISNLNEAVIKLKAYLENYLYVDYSVYEKINMLYYRTFNNEISFVKSIMSEEELNKVVIKINTNSRLNFDIIEVNRIKLISELNSKKKHLKFDSGRARNDNNYFETYFNGSAEEFEKLSLNDIEKKRKYVEYTYDYVQFSVVRYLKDRKEKFNLVHSNLLKVKDVYKSEITNHKIEMAKNIKLPFYIYTAKMLQNYQQGMGIFLHTKEGSESIRFISDPSTDHDVMHHLSSGQLAVISLAFTLAINKTYNISKGLKILTIDDPVQDLDTMNIHSFIELTRHEFLKEYQLILSTHSDINAMFMKYKFEKIDNQEVNLIHVQSELYL
ncbi:AAA family ATPase [Exiguobacterium qingdaonense]|uniref:AAA family ATPase n=1 Tax=Exiguobacterium qingdaonense TaxID=2751251 RepID=UPI001BE835CA|nr:AAA family ATPase [Exiguobacterium qingdaonense]